MKRKYTLTALMVPAASVCAVTLALLVFTSPCSAQNLQTASTQQTQFYGQWTPPAEQPTPRNDATRDKFRGLFPPAVQPAAPEPVVLKPIAQKPIVQPPTDDRIASRYPLAQKPAPVAKALTNARPLQPTSQNNFLQGSFLQPAKEGRSLAHVNHHEASTAEAAMPLPMPRQLSASWPNDAPRMDSVVPVTSESSLSGMVESMQSGGKDLWDKFQSNGSWGDKISSFFGGGDDRFKKVFGSLGIIIGGYLALVALMRKFNFSGNGAIPSEVIEVVGNAPFGPRKNLQLVRLGSKLLLLMNSPEGTHPVGEITDAEEVDYLISLCKGKGTRANSSVMSVVRQLNQRTATPSHVPGRTLHPTNPLPTETTFSASQLVQALESIKNSNRSGTVFEA